MSGTANFEEQELVAKARARAAAKLSRLELRTEILIAIVFAAAAAGLWWLRPPDGTATTSAVLCVLVLVVASRVSFETSFGFTVATQLAFVPLLFSVPVALVPLAVLLALVIASLPEVIRGQLRAAKLMRTPANAWFSIGPSFVFALTGTMPRHAGPAVLLLALLGQFSGDFIASATYFRITAKIRVRAQLRDLWVYMIDAALSGVGLVVAVEVRPHPYAVLALLPLLGLLAMFARERNQRLTGLLELNDTYHGTALLLGDVIAADDGYTGQHSEGVVALALAVGFRLELDARRRRNLEFGALLHDVGKIAIPKEIINKPAKLDPDEWELMKTHTVKGQAMLARVGGFMIEVGTIVRSHHERWDGGGYPDGLAGEAIPLESRIVSCCDAWNAMQTDRPYRKALPYATAVEQMLANAGTQFDPTVVTTLLATVEADAAAEAPAGTQAEVKPAPSASQMPAPSAAVVA